MTASVGSIRAQFEQAIAQNEKAVPNSGGMYLAARLAKKKQNTSSTTSPRKSSSKMPTRPPKSPKSTGRSRQSAAPKTVAPLGSAESVTSRTVSESESEGSAEMKFPQSTDPQHSPIRNKEVKFGNPPPTRHSSPKRNKDRVGGAKKRSSICRHVEIPQSIDEETEEMVGSTIIMCDKGDLDGSFVLNLDDEAGFAGHSPRKGSMVSMEYECDTSQGSTLSRSSPQIRRLPRDLDFDSDDSSMSDDDSAGLAKHRRQARKPLPKPRYW